MFLTRLIYAIYQRASKDVLALQHWPRAEVYRDSSYSLFVFGPQQTLAAAEQNIDNMAYEDFAKNYKRYGLMRPAATAWNTAVN